MLLRDIEGQLGITVAIRLGQSYISSEASSSFQEENALCSGSENQSGLGDVGGSRRIWQKIEK